MAPERLRIPDTNRALPSNMQAVAAEIHKAASLQGQESIDHAIQSFTSIQEQLHGTDELFTLLAETTVQPAGHAEHPLKYFTQEYGTKKDPDPNGIVSTAELLSNLRRHDLHFHQGIATFLKSGIQEALAGLKISVNPNIPRTPVPAALDELISPEMLKNPDRDKLQMTLQTIDEMFSTLKKVQGDVSNLHMNMLRSIRA